MVCVLAWRSLKLLITSLFWTRRFITRTNAMILNYIIISLSFALPTSSLAFEFSNSGVIVMSSIIGIITNVVRFIRNFYRLNKYLKESLLENSSSFSFFFLCLSSSSSLSCSSCSNLLTLASFILFFSFSFPLIILYKM
jgi:hypothetical protein